MLYFHFHTSTSTSTNTNTNTRSFDLGGYQNFIPQSLKDKRKSDDDELQEAIQAEEKRLKEEEERKKLKEIGAAKDDRKLKMKYVKQQMERMEEDRKRESR